MQTAIVKWDESMAARCLARSERHNVNTGYTAPEIKSWIKVPVKTTSEKALSIDIAAEEWDGFEYAISNALKKKHN